MKISKLFHWLYATLMFLPVLVLPAFMIYSHRHTIDTYQINYAQNEIIDFNQYVNNGNQEKTITFDSSNLTLNYQCEPITSKDQICLLKCYFELNQNAYLSFGVTDNLTATYSEYKEFNATGSFHYLQFTTIAPLIDNRTYAFLRVEDSSMYGTSVTMFNCQLFNLTQMFGAGNEPTIQQFDNYFPNDYYEYTLSHKELLNVGSITYNDTDIGSQIIYNLYNVTNNYFNFSNFFSFNGIYDWLLINFFNGNAPLGFELFWQWLCYWVLISIFWLIFDLVMYVPKLAHKWLDKASVE